MYQHKKYSNKEGTPIEINASRCLFDTACPLKTGCAHNMSISGHKYIVSAFFPPSCPPVLCSLILFVIYRVPEPP